MSSGTDLLFSPFSVGSLELPNRVVMAPMTREKSPGGVPGEDVAGYYARRASGGVGLIVTEGTYVDHPSAGLSTAVPLFHGEAPLDGWRRVVEGVHAAGGRIAPQLWHVGAAREPGTGPVPTAPSATPSGLTLAGEPAEGYEALSTTEVEHVVAAFARAAADAHRIGFDAVELHGAHGYLLDQFFWGRTNRRTDRFGGDAAGRARAAAEVVAAVKSQVPADFPVILRMSQWKMGAYDAKLATTPQELESILTPLVDAGVDVFHASTRRYWLPEFEGSDLNFAGWVRKITGRPVITVGSVGLDDEFIRSFGGHPSAPAALDPLLERLERDEFDLVAVGRSLLADPAWAQKVHEGRIDDIVPFTPAHLAELT